MLGMDGIEATEKICGRFPHIRILMLTIFDDEDYIICALRAGACGYLLKNLPASDLAQAIKLAHVGIFQLHPSVAGKLVGNLNQIQPKSELTKTTVSELTKWELEVLKCFAEGGTNREIAKKPFISIGTVCTTFSRFAFHAIYS